MSETDDNIVRVGTPFQRISAIEALSGFHVSVHWKTGKRTVVDLAPDIMTFKVYAALRKDRKLFESIHLVDETVIAWGPDDTIDMHASEIERLAGEVMEAADFQGFLSANNLTRDAAAAQLGISRRMVGYYAKGHEIPRYIALACAQISRRPIEPSSQMPETIPAHTPVG